MERRLTILVIALAVALTACGGDNGDSADDDTSATSAAVVAGDAANGQELYDGTCTSCHGPGGAGVEGLGKPFSGSAFIAAQSDEELVAFIKVGRSTSDPDNTTGVDMPAKGGNPALTDEDIADIVAYIRTVN